MVDITGRLEKIKRMVDDGEYFMINRARQCGKTTLKALAEYLKKDYIVLSLDFQMMSNADFSTETVFCKAFTGYLFRIVRNKKIPIDGFDGEELARLETAARTGDNFTLNRLFVYLSDVCNTTEKPVLLIIDEVDSATNNQVFLDFLAQLRGYYLERDSLPTFQSAILAGVYDVKNIEMKIRPETAHKVNSLWNIASDFPINMSFNADEINGMLLQYEENYKMGMDVCAVAELKKTIYDILFGGDKIIYNSDVRWMDVALMYGFAKNDRGALVISNRIFEMRLYNYFLATSEAQQSEIFRAGLRNKHYFVEGGRLNMRLVLEKFAEHFDEICGDNAEEFGEEEGRRRFLLYLRPITNGSGNCYTEAETRNSRCMDVVVDYGGERFVAELKIWRGNAYNERGEKQVCDYLDYFKLKTGYMISFCFNKNKKPGVREIQYGDCVIVEAVV